MAKFKTGRGRHKALYSLGPETLKKIDMLLVSKGVSQVAKILQEDWGLFKEKRRYSLCKMLSRYKEDVLAANLVTSIAKTLPNGMTLVEETLGVVHPVKVDAHDALVELVVMQTTRLNKLYEREQKMPTLMEQTRKEIQTTGQLLKQLSDLQFDLGIIQRVPRKIQMETLPSNEDIQQKEEVLQLKRRSAEQVVAATNKVFALLESIEDTSSPEG